MTSYLITTSTLYTLKNSMIEYLYLPEIETLVTIKNKKLMYQ
jgi:hypothetical protein